MKQTITETLQDSNTGAPVDLTSSTVTFKLYSTGNDMLMWSHTATVSAPTTGVATYDTVAADFNTAGSYYLIVHVSWVSGKILDFQGEFYEVIVAPSNLVTVNELLGFMDIPAENAKNTASLNDYLEQAETLVNLSCPNLETSTSQKFITMKKVLIKLKAGVLYFMNSDEGSGIDPNLRLAKIRAWQDEFNRAADDLNSLLSSTSTGNAVVRRVANSNYADQTAGTTPLDSDYEA